MATVNPNALSNEEYRAMANAVAAQPYTPEEMLFRQVVPPAAPQSMAALAGGTPSWGAMPPGWMAQMAADITGGRGIAVQQNGYDTTAAMPVAAGPAWAGPSPLPAYDRSGAHMSMPGSREAWEEWGVPPVMRQTSPYATAAYRTYTTPYGQIGVQPLIGFPSEYPHVLSGVPGGLYRHVGEFAQALPFTPLMQMMAMGMYPPMMRPNVSSGSNPGRTNTGNNTKRETPPATTTIPPFVGWQGEGQNTPTMHRGDYIGPLSPENQVWVNSLEPPAPAAQPQTQYRPVGMGSPVSAATIDPNWENPISGWWQAIKDYFNQPVQVRSPYGINYPTMQNATAQPIQTQPVAPDVPQISAPIHSPAETFITPQDTVVPALNPVQPVTPVPQIPAPVNDSLAMLPSSLWGYYG